MTQDKCPLCGCTKHQFVFSQRNHNLLVCDDCEMLFISPYPSDESIYETVTDYEYEDLGILDCRRHYESSKRYYQRYFPMIAQECEQATSLLDVGCGTGRLLELFKGRAGVKRVGIELNAERAKFARNKAACEVYETPIQSFHSPASFDVITLMNVLSHVPDLDGFFSAVHALLSDQGKVILKVGEISREVKKSAVYDWQIPDHLQFLGLNTMPVLAQKFGFKITRHDRVPLADEMFSSSRWRSPGRSGVRNAIKSVVASAPGMLTFLKLIYRSRHGDSVYSSFIVLSRT